MISDLDRYQGLVLKQLIVACGGPVNIGVANVSGRLDAFTVQGAAFQIKHSSKRLSPWRFTYMPENLEELLELSKKFTPVWAVLVCGQDGVVALSLDELRSIARSEDGHPAWVRVSRGRNSMYRVGGNIGDLGKAKARGIEPFTDVLLKPGKTSSMGTA
jgi:hypothetical protein